MSSITEKINQLEALDGEIGQHRKKLIEMETAWVIIAGYCDQVELVAHTLMGRYMNSLFFMKDVMLRTSIRAV